MKEKFVKLAHGSGGVEMHELVEKLIISRVEKKRVEGGLGIDFPDDGALIPMGDGRYLVISTDSYTVNPPFFPGGNIGTLAAAGSINDVLMMGGTPLAALDAVVVEEGFPVEDLSTLLGSMIEVFRSENVAVIGGDFKVMPKGAVDKVIINTTVLGVTRTPIIDVPKEGDKIIVSGHVGDHGAVILLLQMGLGERVEELEKGYLKSDVRPLTKLMLPLVDKYAGHIRAARDPTRGGLAGVLNEWARAAGKVVVLDEARVPMRRPVKDYAEMLGVDPLYLASEGAAVLSVDPSVAEEVVDYMKSLGFGDASIVGEVRSSEKYKGYVLLRSTIGGYRILEPPSGDLVPRIC
ncbi:MAG: hydrogenase expression/formation protein HypE [Acidilobaceae archaeon]|nr:hydrogenase expression/formation protein HypE [Acidilobaceae archaeon]MDW7974714.1 hydrogenase expression/formation protein HypE [Sulfolobales archaeon]